MSTVKLHVPGDIAYRELVTRTIAFICKEGTRSRDKQAARDENFAHELVSAVGEAFNNIAMHGYAGQLVGDVAIEIVFNASRVRVELTDYGNTFDPFAVREPDFPSLPESGMGMFIIRSFVDEVEYSPGPPNVLSLTKWIRPPRSE